MSSRFTAAMFPQIGHPIQSNLSMNCVFEHLGRIRAWMGNSPKTLMRSLCSVIEPVYAPITLRHHHNTQPFTYACDASRLSDFNIGVLGSATPENLVSVHHRSSPEAPFLDRHYSVSTVLQTSPPPDWPSLLLAEFQLMRVHHQSSFPCCHFLPLPYVPTSLPRQN